jgi:hypothetical protein
MSGSASLRYVMGMRGTLRQSLIALLLVAGLSSRPMTAAGTGAGLWRSPGAQAIPREGPGGPRGDRFRRDRHARRCPRGTAGYGDGQPHGRSTRASPWMHADPMPSAEAS